MIKPIKHRKHPELCSGEDFMGNVMFVLGNRYLRPLEDESRKLRNGERLGKQTYDIFDNSVGGRVPLFIRERKRFKRAGR